MRFMAPALELENISPPYIDLETDGMDSITGSAGKFVLRLPKLEGDDAAGALMVNVMQALNIP